MKILFIQTGGSIDKDYPKAKGYSFDISEPAVKRILERGNPKFKFQIRSVLKKDSLDMTKEDRKKIFNVCAESKIKKIIVTHGTDRMVETARVLKDIKDKVIVLTGAARPEVFAISDADFNLGTAVGAINLLENGVYIAINGIIYPYNKVKHVASKGEFIPTK